MMAIVCFSEPIRVHNQIQLAHTCPIKMYDVVNKMYTYSVTQEVNYVMKNHAEKPGNTTTFWIALLKVVLVANFILPLFIYFCA